jgi:TRAP-type C4-dicarboxylate transport system substrate-binding protein
MVLHCGDFIFNFSIHCAGRRRDCHKSGDTRAQGSEWHKILQEMGVEWQKESNGRIAFRLYPGGVTGDDRDIVRKMRLGTLDAALLTVGGLSQIDRGILSLELPMAYADYGELDCVREQIGPQLERRIEAKGFVVLGWSDGGWAHFFSKSAIRTPDDLKKQKMYVGAGDDQYVELVKRAGFNPVPLPSTEIATALQTGLVNAITMSSQGVLLLQWYKQLNHMTDLKWAVVLGGIVITKSTWEKIPVEIRPALRQASLKACQRMHEFSKQTDQRDIDALKNNGVVVITVDEKVLDEWRRLIEEIIPQIRGSYVPAEPLDAALKFRDQCRRQAGKAGK